MSILDNAFPSWYTGTMSKGKKSNKSGEFQGFDMYKTIQLTDQELDLLASMIQYYIGKKRDKPGFEVNNAHIMLRHIIGINAR